MDYLEANQIAYAVNPPPPVGAASWLVSFVAAISTVIGLIVLYNYGIQHPGFWICAVISVAFAWFGYQLANDWRHEQREAYQREWLNYQTNYQRAANGLPPIQYRKPKPLPPLFRRNIPDSERHAQRIEPRI